MRSIRLVSVALVLATLFALPAFAQSTGQVAGTVKDETGAALPGANVTVTNDATGASQSTVAGADGSYSVSGLAAGSYTVEVRLRGFGTSKHKVEVAAGGTGTADFA